MNQSVKPQVPAPLHGFICAGRVVSRYPRGTVLIAEGDAADSMFVLIEGRAHAFSRDERGREVIYQTHEPGEMFGELAIFGGARSASVRAITDVTCFEVNRDELRHALHQDQTFAEYLVATLIGRLRKSTGKVRSLALDSVSSRTLAAIDELSIWSNGVRHLPKTLTQQSVASRIGATREMVNHVFRDLLKAGYLVRDPKLGFIVSNSSLPSDGS